MANLYFLAVAGLSLTPFSPVSYYTTWAPLLLVVGISMLKEGLEDYKRYKQDCAQNASLVDAFGEVSGDRVTVPWSALRPGDVVVVLRDEFFPADLLFLASSHPEGSCYVETMNLDGETNLKLKKCVDATAGLKETDFAGWRAAVECDAPNSSLYTFQGNLLPAGGVGDKVPLGPSSVLLRGSNLRNTEWVMGAVLYAGHDTKVMKNSSKAPSKRSTVERRLDYIIVFMLTLLFTMCLAGSVYLSVRTQRDAPRHWYLAPHGGDTANRAYDPDTPAAVGAYAGITQFILYGYLIPISLYVSIELVKARGGGVWGA